MQSVAAALAAEPALEAVTIYRAQKSIAVATMGAGKHPGLAERLAEEIQLTQAQAAGTSCGLLSGANTCDTCERPLPPEVQQRLTIKQDAETTTIARVTCPTAPRFWHWRSIPLPKVVQRDVEFYEATEHPDE